MAVKNFACLCGEGLGNLGLPGCVKRAGLITKDYFFNTYANDGTRNGILFTDFVDGVLPEAFLLGKLTEVDPSKRWYVTPGEYEEADGSRTDRQTQESATGTTKILRSGQINRSFQLWDVPHNWSAKLNKATCNDVSVISVDESGALVGEVSSDGSAFYGLLIQKGTLYAESFEAKPGEDSYTLVTYQISRLSNEGLYLTIDSSQLGFDARLAKSLIEVDLTQGVGPNTNTEIFVDAFNCTIGTFGNFYPLQGATAIGDWKVFTTAGTGGTEIVITAVEELDPGKYKITLTADAATTVYLSFVKVKTSISDFGYVADQVAINKP